MMDIVKRLRAYYKTDDAPQLVDEAADEIERLRVELAEEIQQYEDCREQLVSAQASEAKLRERERVALMVEDNFDFLRG